MQHQSLRGSGRHTSAHRQHAAQQCMRTAIARPAASRRAAAGRVSAISTNSPSDTATSWHKSKLKHVVDSQQFNRESLEAIFAEAIQMEKVKPGGHGFGHAWPDSIIYWVVATKHGSGCQAASQWLCLPWVLVKP